VQLVRSVVDASVDSSTYWRDVENWNVAMTLREHPLVGLGLGGEYTEFMPNADISVRYRDYRAWPHNSVLGLLLFAGLFGFTLLWTLFAIVVFLAVRAHRRARTPEERVAALACIAAVVVCVLMAFGDTGAHFTQYRVFAALALSVVGKLAVATGAWPARLRRIDPNGV
jgi:O-antigen ligase